MAESAVLTEGVTRGRRNPLHHTLPARLRKAREGQGLSARALSLRAGLAHNACVGIEGGRIPGVDVAERLARALGCSPCELAYGVQGAPLPPEDALRSAGCGERLRQLREARGLSKRIPRENVEKRKSELEAAMIEVVVRVDQSPPRACSTFREICIQIDRLLNQNSVLFWSFGPASPMAEDNPDPSVANLWKNVIRTKILPNNKVISDLLVMNRDLYINNPEFGELANRFIAHESSYSYFIDHPNSHHENFPFPAEFAEAVAEEAARNV